MVKIKGDRSMFIYLAIIDSPEGKLKFEVIYERYKGLMFYTANSVLGDTRDSEDIVHDAFLKIIEIIDEIDDPKSPQTRYLIVTITGNVKKCAVGKHPKSEKLGSTGQAACCARIHSRYFTGGNPSGLRV